MERRDFLLKVFVGVASGLLPSVTYANNPEGKLITGYDVESLSGVILLNLAPIISKITEIDYQPKAISGEAQQKALRFLAAERGDGLTAMLTIKGALVLSPLLQKKQLIELDKDVKVVAKICEIPLAFVVGPNVPASVTSLEEYFAWQRNNPEGVYIGVSGYGSPFHFLAMNIRRNSKSLIKFIHYSSTTAIHKDLEKGRLNAGILFAGHLYDESISRPIAISSPERWIQYEHVPTFNEQGFKDCNIVETYCICVPSNTAESTRQHIHDVCNAAVATPEFKSFCDQMALLPKTASTENLEAELKVEQQYWKEMVQRNNISLIDD